MMTIFILINLMVVALDIEAIICWDKDSMVIIILSNKGIFFEFPEKYSWENANLIL